jgi:hypothetical protein
MRSMKGGREAEEVLEVVAAPQACPRAFCCVGWEFSRYPHTMVGARWVGGFASPWRRLELTTEPV